MTVWKNVVLDASAQFERKRGQIIRAISQPFK